MNKILVVDDESKMELLIREKFQRKNKTKNFHLVFARDGIEALKKLDEHKDIKLVLADINMPRMDGLTLLSKIKELGRTLFTIILTAYGDMGNIRAAMNKGAYDFLLKPLDFKDVEITILNAFEELKKIQKNITQRVLAEKESLKLEAAINQISESIVITDTEGKVEYINPAFEKMTGYSREEVMGENQNILKSGLQEESFYKKLWDTITEGKVWKSHLVNKKKDGSFFEVELSISPILDENGKITNFVGVKRNITHEIQLEKQLRQAQKMEAIGTLAGGIAHDFNNILFAMLGYVELARKTLPVNTKANHFLKKVLNSGDRAKDLVQQILTFSRKEDTKLQPVHFIPILKEVIKLLRSTLPSSIEIEQEIDVYCDNVLADPTQLHQIIINLCINAEHAMRKSGGILGICLYQERISPDFANLHNLVETDYLILVISDTGIGMHRETMDKMFDPFFTTKPVGEGTGMGLSIVTGIVGSHNGTIIVESVLGEGTKIKVYFPISKIEKEETLPKKSEVLEGNELILIVDDEEDLLILEQLVLEELGYKVIVARDGEKALEIFRQQSKKIDLVITDQTMPIMNGDTLAKNMLEIRKDIPIILLTGYSHTFDKEKAKKLGIKKMATKPIDNTKFGELVYQVLHNSD